MADYSALADLPTLAPDPGVLAARQAAAAAPAPAPTGVLGALGAGFKGGLYGTGSALAGFGSGAAKLVGADGVSQALGQKASELAADAHAVSGGLDTADYTGHGAGQFINKVAYTAGSLIPQIGGAIAGTVAAGAALPEEAAAGAGLGIARLGASLPKFLGGAGLGAGFAEGVAPEVLASGLNTGKAVLGAAASMVPQAIGGDVNAAAEQPGGLTYGGAAKAFAMGTPVGLVQSLAPADFAIGKGAAGSVLGRSVKDAAANAVGSGLQTASELSYDPNMSTQDKLNAVVASAAGGAAVGGLLGVGFGMLHGKPGAQGDLDAELKAQGLDPADPAGTGPSAPPPPAPPSGSPQLGLDLRAPLQAPASTDPQLSLLTPPEPQGPTRPMGEVATPQTSVEQRYAEIMAEKAAARAPAAPAPAPAAPGAAPAPNLALQMVQTPGSDIRLGARNSVFRQFVEQSQAIDPADLHREIADVGATSKLGLDPSFAKLAERLGVGIPDLDAQIARLEANPETANAQALAELRMKARIRDTAAARDAAAAAPVAEAPAAEPVAQPATPVAPVTAPVAEPDAPRNVADTQIAQPITAQNLDLPLAGLEPEPDPNAVSKPTGAAATLAAPDPASMPAQAAPVAPASDGPLSIADRVLQAARAAVGDKGGEVSVADLRKALPDLHKDDLDNALRAIHADDTDNTLAQNAKGQRNGVDGVTVAGLGRMHRLEVEPTDAVQEPSAAGQAVGDQPQGGGADGGGNAGRLEAAGPADDAGAAGRPPGAPDLPEAGAQALGRIVDPEQFDGIAPEERADHAAHVTDVQARFPSALDSLDTLTPDKVQERLDAARAQESADYANAYGEDGEAARKMVGRLGNTSNDNTYEALQRKLEALADKHGLADNSSAMARTEGVGYPHEAIPDFWQDVKDKLSRLENADTVRDQAAVLRHELRNLPTSDDPAKFRPDQIASMIGVNAALKKLTDGGLTERQALEKAAAAGGRRDGNDTLELFASDMQRYKALRGGDPDPRDQTTPAQPALEAKLAPQDVASPDKAAPQLQFDLGKVDAASRLAVPDAASAPAADAVRTKLRRQAVAKTAIVETGRGDQIPTEAVGSRLSDIPQAMQDVEDQPGTVPPRQGPGYQFGDRFYEPHSEADAIRSADGYQIKGDRDAQGNPFKQQYREVFTAQLAKAEAGVKRLESRLAKTLATGRDPLVKGDLGEAKLREPFLRRDIESARTSLEYIRMKVATALPRVPEADTPELTKQVQDEMPGVPVTPMPRDQVQAQFDKHVARLPESVRDRIKLVGGDEDIPGRGPLGDRNAALYRDGQIWVNADAVRSAADLQDTISHEVFGHFATARATAEEDGRLNAGTYQRAMKGMYDRAGGAEGLEKLARKVGVWDQLKEYLPPDGREATPHEAARLMDELLSHVAGAGEPPALTRGFQAVQRALQTTLVNIMRRAGLHDFARRLDRFGPAQVAGWLAETRRALAVQPKPGDIDLMRGATTPRDVVQGVEPTGNAPFMAKLASQQKDHEGAIGTLGALASALRSKIDYASLYRDPLKAPGVSKPLKSEVAKGVVRAIRDNLATAQGLAQEALRYGLGDTMVRIREADMARRNAMVMLNGAPQKAIQDFLNLRQLDRDRAGKVEELMHIVTQRGFDVTKPFEAHTWLTEGQPVDEQQRIRAHFDDAMQRFNALARDMKGGRPSTAQRVFLDQAMVGRAMLHMREAVKLHDGMSTAFGDKLDLGYHPIKRYIGADGAVDAQGKPLNEGLRNNLKATADFMQAERDRLLGIAKAHLDAEDRRLYRAQAQGGRVVPNGAVEAARGSEYQQLAGAIRMAEQTQANLIDKGMYFREGRTGNHAVSFYIKPLLDADGKPVGDRPDPAALEAIRARMAKDFPQVTIGASDSNRKVFARFPSQEVARNFHELVAEGGALRQHVDPSKDTMAMLLEHARSHDSAVPFLKDQIDASSAAFDREIASLEPDDPRRAQLADNKAKYIAALRAHVLDLSGDTSMRSYLSSRDNVQGARTDMVSNQRDMASSYAAAAASTTFRQEINDAAAEARARITKATKGAGAVDKAARMQRLYNAFMDRRTAADVRPGSTIVDAIRSGMHTFQLAGSFGYAMLNIGQLGTLTAPELMRFHRPDRAVTALTGSLPSVGRVLRAMWSTRVENADGSKGVRNVLQGGITKAVLDAAGLSTRDRNSLSRLVNEGHVEMGGFAANDAHAEIGGLKTRLARFKHYADQTAVMTETASRLSAAFAAMKLHDDTAAAVEKGQGNRRQVSMMRQFPDRESYAAHVINETMMGWGSFETPKIMTAGGFAGPLGPLVGQFHGWVPRLAEKLYRETADGVSNRLAKSGELGPRAAADAKAEAQRFMFAHLALTTAVAGGLGLPLAGYMAAAATGLSGLFLKQPYDVEAHLRNGLSDILGKDVGEIVSRGLPRYLGADLSNLGDDNLGPFSRFVEDRRKFEDAAQDYLAHAWGSFPAALINAGIGARDIAQGRVAEGLSKALPTAMRNVVRAYRVSQEGYVNSSNGERLPIPAGAAEVIKTALGVTGGQLAEERERQNALYGLQDDRQKLETRIKKDAALARARNDPAGVAAAMQEAAQYERDNPGVKFVSQLRDYIQNRYRSEAVAAQTGTLGANPRDRVALSLLQH